MSEIRDTLFSQMPTIGGMRGQLVNRTRGDKYIWGIVVLLSLISILVVYSATGSLAYKMSKGNTSVYLFKQVSFSLVGLVLIYFLHRINYTIFSKVATILFLVSIPLLLYTLLFGAKINDGSRWIKLPIINMTVQTSDLAKLALFMYISRLLSKKQDTIKDFKKRISPCCHPGAHHLRFDHARQFIQCITHRCHCFAADVYWQGKFETYFFNDWCSIDTGYDYCFGCDVNLRCKTKIGPGKTGYSRESKIIW